ncbi:MAG: DNA repair and recombination protein RadA, partial [Candidatus Bathyarchaeia archaeon]
AKVLAEARGSLALNFVRADELIKMRQNVRRLSTGSKQIDELLGGGLETQTITEFYGEYGVGKSILCHQLAVNVQLPENKGGLNGAALYIDTENTFRTEWIIRMAEALGLDPTQTAKNIIYSEAFNSDHQVLLLEKADKVIQENNVKLIILDSLTSHFRSEYLGREMLAERQQKLNSHMHRLVRLARAFNASAVVTNQVMSKPDQFFAMAVEAVGGHIVAHTSHTRVFLRRTASGPVRICRLISSPYLPEGERIFKITEEGIKDIAEEDEIKRRR